MEVCALLSAILVNIVSLNLSEHAKTSLSHEFTSKLYLASLLHNRQDKVKKKLKKSARTSCSEGFKLRNL